MSTPGRKGTEFLNELQDHMHDTLGKFFEDEELRHVAVKAILDRVRHVWGGTMQYIPKGQQLDLDERDLAIWADYNGFNQDALVRKYKVSLQHIYNIIKRVRAAEHRRTQPDLFPETNPDNE